jgi:hypothetical protein
MTGNVSPIETVAGNDGSTRVALSIEPYGSRVLVFSKRILRSTQTRVTQAVPASIDLSRDWRVTFGPNGKSETFDRLSSWTEQDATKYFSGTAVYEKVVNIQAGLLKDQLSVQLDFGEGKPLPVQTLKAGMQAWLDAPVRDAAVVFVNGQKAGSTWCPPYRVDITGLLRPGVNKLRIVVANLALNYMAGQRQPDYRLLNLRFGERFQVQDMDKIRSEPSGLLGPIRLVWENR